MDDEPGKRLAAAVSALIAHFKMGPDGAAYENLSLTDTAVLSRVATAAAAGRDPIQKEVGNALRLPKTTMTSAVKRLRARGLVEQELGAKDARARVLRLTPRGHELATDLKDAQVRASMTILESLPARDQALLIELLETVATRVNRE